MKLYPLFTNLHNRTVLVVGGGKVAERKASMLLAAGARVHVGAPTLTAQLAQQSADGKLQHLVGSFQPQWLDNVWLVIAATDDTACNADILAAAEKRRIFANVVDNAELSSFQVPAVVDRAPLSIAISSAGAAPALARRVRELVETLLDHSLGDLLILAQQYKPQIRRKFVQLSARRRFYDWLHDGPVAGLLRAQQPVAAEQALRTALKQTAVPSIRGRVLLVGAGPGDPGLLTLNALRALHRADVILHDRLIGDAVLALARRDAECIDVGKRRGENPHTTQRRIHNLMLQHASDGQCVVRLKGGDPFVFGRGGEELEFLRAHEVDYEVIPGITAANACAAYAGIPLTHREHAQSVHFLTAHCKNSFDTLDWTALARERQTLAIYMGVGQLDTLMRELLAHGRAASTPFALVENGSRPEQRVVSGQLSQLSQLARAHNVRAPALLILGEVAALGPRLAWFGRCTSSAALDAVAA